MRERMTPNQVALALLIVGDVGLMIMILLNLRGWPAMVFGITAAIGCAGWLGTLSRTRAKKEDK